MKKYGVELMKEFVEAGAAYAWINDYTEMVVIGRDGECLGKISNSRLVGSRESGFKTMEGYTFVVMDYLKSIGWYLAPHGRLEPKPEQSPVPTPG